MSFVPLTFTACRLETKMSSDYEPPNIDIASVEFVEFIKETDSGFLCRARWQDKDCVLKVVSEKFIQLAYDL